MTFECYSPIEDLEKARDNLSICTMLQEIRLIFISIKALPFADPDYMQCASRAGHYFLLFWKCPDVIVNFIIRKSLRLFRGCCSMPNIKLQTALRFPWNLSLCLDELIPEKLCPRTNLFNGNYNCFLLSTEDSFSSIL